MNKMKQLVSVSFYPVVILSSFLLFQSAYADDTHLINHEIKLAGNVYYASVDLKLTAKQTIDLQDATIQLKTPTKVSSAWGDFPGIAYPTVTVSSKADGGGYYNTLINLEFPKGSQWWKPKSTLDTGKSITLKFGINGAVSQALLSDHVKLYLDNAPIPVVSGKLIIEAPSSPSAEVASQKAVATIKGPGDYQKTVSLNWGESTVLDELVLGDYAVSSAQVGPFPGKKVDVSLNEDAHNKTIILSYAPAILPSVLTASVQAAPFDNVGVLPTVHIHDLNDGTQLALNLAFGSSHSLDLTVGHTYQVYADVIESNNKELLPNYSQEKPLTFTAVADKTHAFALNYTVKDKPVIETTSLIADVSGLPDQSVQAFLTLTGTEGNVYTLTVHNGEHLVFDGIDKGVYDIQVSEVTHHGERYRANVDDQIALLSPETLSISFTKKATTGERIYAPYADLTLNAKWSSERNAMDAMDLSAIGQKSGVKDFVGAFIVAQSGNQCVPAWGGYPDYTVSSGFAKASIQGVQDAGGQVIISFGGLNGTYLSQACSSVDALANAYRDVIDTYHVDHIDFDVEGTQVADQAAMNRMLDALLVIQKEYPDLKVGFTVQVAPKDGLNYYAKYVLQQAVNKGVMFDLVNIMTMDYGAWNTDTQPDQMYQHAVNSAQKTFDFLSTIMPNKSDAQIWGLIGLTPMIGVNDVWYYGGLPQPEPERFTLSDTDKLVEWAKAKGVHFLSAWSITRDLPCGNAYASAICSGAVNGQYMQTENYEFSKHFNQFLK